jgi:hypothetical protein
VEHFQSPTCCFITGLAVGQESNGLYATMDEETGHFVDSRSVQDLGYSLWADGQKCWESRTNAGDLAMLQKSVQRGGAARQHTGARSCVFCCDTNEEQTRAKEGINRCADCVRLEKPRCFCSSMATADNLKEKQAEIAELVADAAFGLPPAQQFLRQKELTAAGSKGFCEALGLDAGGAHGERQDALSAYCAEHCIKTGAGKTDDHSIDFDFPTGREDIAVRRRGIFSDLVDKNIDSFDREPEAVRCHCHPRRSWLVGAGPGRGAEGGSDGPPRRAPHTRDGAAGACPPLTRRRLTRLST